jgi:hypothetical protein
MRHKGDADKRKEEKHERPTPIRGWSWQHDDTKRLKNFVDRVRKLKRKEVKRNRSRKL